MKITTPGEDYRNDYDNANSAGEDRSITNR